MLCKLCSPDRAMVGRHAHTHSVSALLLVSNWSLDGRAASTVISAHIQSACVFFVEIQSESFAMGVGQHNKQNVACALQGLFILCNPGKLNKQNPPSPPNIEPTWVYSGPKLVDGSARKAETSVLTHRFQVFRPRSHMARKLLCTQML